MTIDQIVNRVLGLLNLALVRKSTLNTTLAALETSQNLLHALQARQQAKLTEHKSSSTTQAIETILSAQDTRFSQLAQCQDTLGQKLLRHQIASHWRGVDHLDKRLPVHGGDSRQCPLCLIRASANDFKLLNSHCIFGGGALYRYQCPQCDLVFGPDKMFGLNEAELSEDYEWHYQAYQEGDSTAAELRAFHALQPRKEGVYLNYGAGSWSQSVQQLRSEGWQVYAYEPHSSAAPQMDYVITDRRVLLGMAFDGIFSNNVLEHLRRPVDDLIALSRLLKPGAVMAHATPCYEYLYEFTRFHLYFFTGRSRTLLADKANLSVKNYVQDGEFMCAVFEAAIV